VSATIAARADRARVRWQRSNSVKQRVSYSRRFPVSIKGFVADREEIGLNATILAIIPVRRALPDGPGARPDPEARERFPIVEPDPRDVPQPAPGA